MTVELFSQITNIALIVLFLVAIVSIFIAGLIGFKNGVWRTTIRMCIFGLLFTVAICTLEPTANMIGKLPIDWIGYKTIALSRTMADSTKVVYNVPITTLSETVTNAFKGYYLLYNIAGNSARAAELALAIASTVLKWVTFTVDVILIIALGWILDVLLWNLAFKHIIPKLVRKKIKWPWFAMVQNVVTYVVSAFMLLAPVSSIINAINTPLKNADTKDNTSTVVLYMDSFLQNYNNSLFAKTFINWTADANGLTLDAQVMSSLTSTTFENVEISIIDSVYSISEIGSALLGSLLIEDGGVKISLPSVLSTEVVTSIFDALDDSGLILSILPVASELAMNEELLGKILKDIDPSVLNMSDVDWRAELRNAETIILDLINSDIASNLISDDGKTIKKIDLKTFIPQCMTATTFAKVEHALATIDDSKLLSRLIPSLITWLSSSNETAAKFLPNNWDELNDIKWGFELSTLLECVHEVYLTNPEVLNLALDSIGSKTTASSIKRDGTAEETSEDIKSKLAKLIVKDIDSYQNILIGEFDNNGNPLNVDKLGRTVVYSNGKKITGRSYCLLDLQLSKTLMEPLLTMLTNTLGGSSSDSSDPSPSPLIKKINTADIVKIVDEVVADMSKGVWRTNFKQELNSIFYTFKSFKDNPDAISSLVSGKSIIPSSGNITDLEPGVTNCLAKALPRMDRSKLLSAIIYPLLEEILLSNNTKTMLTDLGIDVDLVSAGSQLCKDNNEFGYEMAKLIRTVKHISVMSDCLNAGSSNAILSAIGENSESVAYVLDTFHSCKIINPTRDQAMVINSENVKLNQNFYEILDYVFGTALTVPGFSFKENEILPTTVWENAKTSDGDFFRDRYGDAIYSGESGAIAEVLKLIGSSGICACLDDPDFFKSNENLVKLAKTTAQGGYDLPGILAAVERSNVFSATMGDFLDETLKDMHIVGSADVSFNNVTNWEIEGQNLAKVLLCLDGVELNLNSLNLSACQDVVSLNRLMHALAESTIFVNKVDGEFLFSKWIFAKFADNENGLTNLFTGYNLIADPDHSNWDTRWNNYQNYKTAPTGMENYSILYNDLCSLDEREDWSSSSFDFNSAKTQTSTYGNIADYDLTNFYAQYKGIFELDELGRICELVYWTNKATSAASPIDMDSTVFDGLLDTLNDTTCLRIGVYNLYEIAKLAINEKPKVKEFFDLSPEYDTYVINCDFQSMSMFSEAREKRATEIGYLKSLFKAYRYMSNGVLDVNTGKFNSDKVDPECVSLLKEAVRSVNMSLVFHRKGSALYDASLPGEYYPTVFQNLLAALYLKTDLKSIIYCDSNPKDVYYSTVDVLYDPNVESKVQWMNEEYFNWHFASGVNTEIQFAWQLNEIDKIFDFMNAICGGSKLDGTGSYKGLKKKNSHNEYEITFSIQDFDIALTDNVYAVKEILEALNKTSTLYDGAPNAIYSALTESGLATQFSSLNKVNFGDANIFYHYFDNIDPMSPNPYNWKAKLTDSNTSGVTEKSDVDFITDLMMEASLYASSIPSIKATSIISNFEDINEADVNKLEDFLLDTLHSKVFHSSGPRKTIDNAGNVVMVSGSTKTVFQEIIEEFLSANDIANNIIDATNNPKDAGLTLDDKVESIAINVFPSSASSFIQQEKEIGYLCDFLECAKDFATSDLVNVDMGSDSLDADALFAILETMNNSACLYDCVPNIINKALSTTSFSQFGSEVDLTDANPYYHYNVGSLDYTRRYSESELNALHGIIVSYQDLNATIQGYHIDDVFIIDAICQNGSLRGVLENMHNSGMFHLHHDKNQVDGELTVFESAVYYFVKMSGLDEFTYGAADARTRMVANIEAVTEREQTLPDVNTQSYYHNQWVAVSNYDELTAFLDFVSTGTDFLSDSASFDLADISFGGGKDYDPHDIANLMKKINKTDFISDALPVFVKQGFESISLDSLTTLGTEHYSYYNLSQKEYGVATMRGDITACEIDLIEDALENMYQRSGNTGTYISLGNITDFVTRVDSLEGIVKFAQYGRILNTSQAGVYNEMTASGSYNVSARGILFYNIFKNATPSSDGVTAYISGTDEVSRSATLSKIFTFEDISGSNYSYRYESEGVMQLAHDASSLDPNTFVTANFNNFSTIEPQIDRLLEDCYNIDGYYHKSYFTVEIMSNFLSEIVDSEANKISVTTDISFGPTSVSPNCDEIVPTAFTDMSVLELKGVCASIDFFKTFKDYLSSHVGDRATFISKMNALDGSKFAKLIWAAEIDTLLSSNPATASYVLNPLNTSFTTFSAHSDALATQLGL